MSKVGVPLRLKKMAEGAGDAEEEEASSSRSLPHDLPKGELVLALLLAVPCLAYVFSLPYLLYHGFEPATDNANRTSAVAEENIRFMRRTVFTDFPFPTHEVRTKKEKGVQVLFIVFAACGGLAGSVASDVVGRRSVANLATSSTVVCGFLLTLAPSFLYFQVAWSALSVSLMASYTVTFIRVLELLPGRLRLPSALVFFGGSWILSRFAATALAVATRDWTLVAFFLSLWLCAVMLLAQVSPGRIREVRFDDEDRRHAFHEIFARPGLLGRLAVLSFSWLVCGTVFFGLNLSRNGFFTDNLYANMLFPGLVDFLALVLAAVTCHATSRTLPVFMVFMLLNGLCLFAMAPFQTCSANDDASSSSDREWVPCRDSARGLVLLTQFSSLFTGGACWSILWLVTASAFPTRMRSTSVGVCSFVARVGSLLGIVLVEEGMVYGRPTSLAAAGLASLAAGVLPMLFLTEAASSERPLCKSLEEQRRREEEASRRRRRDQDIDTNA